MKSKTRKRKGAILIEMAISISVNMIFLLGGLEIGWYLHVRGALVAASEQAAFSVNGNEAELVALTYLTGMDLPQSLIDSCTVQFSSNTIAGTGGVKIKTATLSLPTSEVLIFGNLAMLQPLIDQVTISETAYVRSKTGN